MRRETKRTDTEAPEGAVPAEFTIDGVDVAGAFRDLGRELEADGLDLSGRDKALRLLRPAAWKLHLVGGGATADRGHLARLRLHRHETEARAVDFEARGLRRAAESLRSGLPSIDRDIAKHAALVAAAGDAVSHDQSAKKARLDAARSKVAGLNSELERYRLARIASPERSGLEDRLLKAEREQTEAEDAWKAGVREFEAAGAQVARLRTKLYQAIVAEGESLCNRLGEQAAELCAGDLALFRRFPNRAPDGVIALAQRAERVSALMDSLGSAGGRGLAAFWNGCGDDADAIVAGKLGVKVPGRRDNWSRRRKTLADVAVDLGAEARVGEA